MPLDDLFLISFLQKPSGVKTNLNLFKSASLIK